jgi:hypothetical protein
MVCDWMVERRRRGALAIQCAPKVAKVVGYIRGRGYPSWLAVRLWNYGVILERHHQRVGALVQELAEKLLPPPPPLQLPGVCFAF